MFNGMTVVFVGSLIWEPLLRWGLRILVLKAFVQGGLQTDWLDSGQLLFKPLLPSAILHTFGIGKESAFSPFHTLCILFVQCIGLSFDIMWSAGRALRAFP